MLRTAAKASSAFMQIAAATSTARHKLLNPAISAVAAVPYHPNLASHRYQTALLFFPAILGQSRGYASGLRAPADDKDLSDDDMDSDDFESGGEDLPDDDEEGITDEESVDEDEIKDESD